MGIVDQILKDAQEKESKYKSIDVEKSIELELDEGNLLAVDINPLDTKALKADREGFLKNLARDNSQLLLNRIWELPVERKEDAVVVQLPDPKFVLPREKPVPKDRALTKWQEYAKLKGIQNKKRGRMAWDDVSQEWKPRWGYKRANDDTKEWLLEVPQTADPFEDQFAKKIKEKKERVAKNELQRLRNIARNMKGKVPGVGLTPTEKPDKDYLSTALTAAKKSTASVGKFTETLQKEKPAKNQGKKRKFQPNIGNFDTEKKKNLDILSKLHNKKPKIDKEQAANKQINAENMKRAAKNAEGGGKKPKAGKRQGQQAGGGVKRGKQGSKRGKGGKGRGGKR